MSQKTNLRIKLFFYNTLKVKYIYMYIYPDIDN